MNVTKKVVIIGLEKIPLINRGDDIAFLIVDSAKNEGASLQDGDIIVVGHKIVSKSEGRIIEVSRVKPSEKAIILARRLGRNSGLIESILREAREFIKVWGRSLIVRNLRGMVCINSGLDKSNVNGEDTYTLLPKKPDMSAENLRRKIKNLTKKNVGVVITDTYSRPFRRGIVDLAIGVSGVKVFKDYRGCKDLFGHRLHFKYVAIIDEIASAAELVIGQGDEKVPVAIIRGLSGQLSDGFMSSSDLLIDKNEDMYIGAL